MQNPYSPVSRWRTFSFGKRFAVLFLAAILGTARFLSAQDVLAEARILGAKEFSKSEILETLRWREGEPWDPVSESESLSRLLERYRAAGYFFTRVSSQTQDDGETRRMTLTVDEGAQARLAGLDIEGAILLSGDAIRRELGVRIGGLFDAVRWKRGMERLLERYAERGHPYAKLTPIVTDAHRESGEVRLKLHVEEGQEIRLEAVQIEGLKKTKESVVRRLLPLRVGERFDRRRIESARYQLRNSGLFQTIHPNLLQRGASPDAVIFRARVEEARTGQVEGVLGYAPPQGATDTPQFTGYFQFIERNLLGTGRQVEFRWESAENRATHLAYREPFVFGLPLSVSLGWDSERFEESFRQNGVLRTDWQPNPFVSFGVGAQRMEADGLTGSGALSEALYDSRDYRPNPFRGMRVRLRGDAYTGDVRFRRISGDGEWLLPVRSNHAVGARGSYGRAFGVDIPLTEWYFLGGASTLRGYREREFRGTERAFGSLEYRVRTGRDSRVFAFFDAGAAWSSADRTPLKVGYGVGANLESRGGLIRLDYGLSPDTSPLEGKIHLQLGAEF